MNPVYYRDTGLLHSQIQDMSFSQELSFNKQLWLKVEPAIKRILRSFTERDQSIFKLTYLNDERKTCREIAKIHNISPQRVSQIQRKLFKLLKFKISKIDIT